MQLASAVASVASAVASAVASVASVASVQLGRPRQPLALLGVALPG